MRQATGKRDCADVMIHEGDIVSYEHGRINLRGTFVVVFKPEGGDELRTITNLELEQAMGDYLTAGIVDLADELGVRTSTILYKMASDMRYIEEICQQRPAQEEKA